MRFGAGGRCPRAAVGALCIALGAVPLASQLPAAPGSRDSLTSELAARIAAAIAPATQVSLEMPTDDVTLQDEIGSRLAALGVRIVNAVDGVPSARASCLDNLRERACSAEIDGTARTTVIVTRPHAPVARESAPGIALELRPVLSQQTRILDLARAGDSIFVLSPTAVVQYKQMGGSWRSVESRPISTARPWPRDVRGRIRVARGKVDVFLPGVTCSGDDDDGPMVCSEGVVAWPLDIEDVTLDPARNYFRTSDGLTFYGIARLSGDAGARWLAATVDRTLTFVDDGRQLSATTVSADDVVALRASCSGRSYVVAASTDRGRDVDLLTPFEVVRRRLVAAASPARLAGKITALWSTPNADVATVITYDRADRYDAHELAVSCSR